MRKGIFLSLITISILIVPITHRLLFLERTFPDEYSIIPDDYLSSPYKVVKYNNLFIVSDAENGCLKLFSDKGRLVKTIGRKGQGPGEIGRCYVFALDKESGIIYCYDSDNSRISLFHIDGKYIKSIRTSLNIWDMIFFNKYLIMSSYNEPNRSLFVKMDPQGNIIQFFGDFFDREINKLPREYQKHFYGAFTFWIDGDLLYAFSWYLPYILEFDSFCNTKKIINIQTNEALEVYKKNLNAYKTRFGARLGINYWMKGASVIDGNIYCYSISKKHGLLIIDQNGNLKEKIEFADKAEQESIKIYSGVFDNEYIFIDGDLIKIFKERNNLISGTPEWRVLPSFKQRTK